MPHSIQCPACRRILSARDDQVGERFKCPGCGDSISVPASVSRVSAAQLTVPASASDSSKAPVASDRATLLVKYPGQFFLFDLSVEILLDGQLVGTGYV